MTTDLDKRKLRAAFERSASRYDQSAVLQREVADRLLSRLDMVKLDPKRILDVGSGTGYCTRALAKRYGAARVYGLDLSHAMSCRARRASGWLSRQRYVCGDAEALPLATDSVDLLISNLALQWCQPQTVFAECFRVLRPGGLLMFTSFGPDTLGELRQAWRSVDGDVHVHEFIDMHDLGDALVTSRFADPVMDMETLALTYPDVLSAVRDLKAIGASNAALGRARGLTGKDHFARFRQAYEALAQAGRIPATYEVVYGHAWVPVRKPMSEPGEDGEIRVPLTHIGRPGS